MTAPTSPLLKRPFNPVPTRDRVTGIRPGIQLRGLGKKQLPVADWLCVCGHHERATGHNAVTALATRATVGDCPHAADTAAPPNVEGAKDVARQGVLSAVHPSQLPDSATLRGPERRNAA